MENKEPTVIPDKFEKIISDFIGDIIITFPEYELLINKWAHKPDWVTTIFNYCLTVFPERFLDILYKNVDIFGQDSVVNTDFLPGISFRYLWQCDISDSTKETIWKYLQLISVTIVGSVNKSDAFGDTAKIFESINEVEFKEKLAETLEKMQSIFTQDSGDNQNTDSNHPDSESSGTNSNPNPESNGMPSADDIHNHITGMMGGKLGDLAREIAEETAGNLNMDMENVTDVKDIFQNLFKNPGKLMGLVKNVGDKLDSRIKSGDIKESELLAEATDLMGKMQNMPGMDNIQEMLAKMGLGKKTKVNTSAMEAQLAQNTKMAQMKERMKKNLEQKKTATQMASPAPVLTQVPSLTDEQLISVFSSGEKVEKTMRNAIPATVTTDGGKKKKGKGKK